MGQSASASSSKDDSYDEKNTDQSIDSSEESYEEQTTEHTSTVMDEQKTHNRRETLGLQEVLLQLKNLSIEDLKKKIEIATLTRENILEVTRSYREDLVAMNDKYAYVDLYQDLEEKMEEKIALRILQLSPNLRYLRYKLVPSRLKEGLFWAAIFRLMANTLIYSNIDTIEPEKGIILEVKPSKSIVVEQSSHFSSSMSVKLDKSEARIKELELALEAAYEILRETKDESSERPTEKKAHHKGRWVIDKDCKEFLSLDKDVKKQLREGKKKRIQDILNELRFILDSDDEREARGKWDCCGNNEYMGFGCSS